MECGKNKDEQNLCLPHRIIHTITGRFHKQAGTKSAFPAFLPSAGSGRDSGSEGRLSKPIVQAACACEIESFDLEV